MCETWEEADGTFRTHLAQVSVAHGEGEWMQVGVEGKVGRGRGEGGGGFREAEVKVSNYLLSIAITHSSETN